MNIGCKFTTLIVYVDDILVNVNDDDRFNEHFLDTELTIKDTGNAYYFLGIEIHQSSKGILVSQHKYILDILEETNMLDVKPCTTPFSVDCKL